MKVYTKRGGSLTSSCLSEEFNFYTKRGGSLVSNCFNGEIKWKFIPTGVAA